MLSYLKDKLHIAINYSHLFILPHEDTVLYVPFFVKKNALMILSCYYQPHVDSGGFLTFSICPQESQYFFHLPFSHIYPNINDFILSFNIWLHLLKNYEVLLSFILDRFAT